MMERGKAESGPEAGSANIIVAGVAVYLQKGDITRQRVEAIVNAANTSLAGGGGVDGAIHRAGGPSIMEECNEIRKQRGGVATGEAVYTSAGRLPATYVFHTAGPVWHGGKNGEGRLLAECYRSCLQLAERLEVTSISFPAISTGVYDFPKQKAAEIALQTVQKWLNKHPGKLKEVRFVNFEEENHRLYLEVLQSLDI
ncbi:O-acetyl-ADP-ribose deacetylase [Nafulsella turpanensis]|uniref:O-acetyl-ADP-ribose deacetylase n=1 Tax=Nafulsella turpanensis TaxID=1265690 RepID=UPI000349FD64|nr:O-acetyl-ADP-ribose deacetylase [Nafulsella turpanensis]